VKRFLILVLALLLLTCPALAGEKFTLAASAARTAAGTGTAVEVGNLRNLFVSVSVTAGSGTVNPFRVWLEASNDGTVFLEVPCKLVMETAIAAPGAGTANQRDLLSKVAVLTTGKFIGFCEVWAPTIRAAWNIAGTTPSETFEVLAYAK
jgi:hypothetical protein